MNNDRKHLIPDLRFPQFVNDAEWKNKELGEYLDYIQPTNYLVNSTSYDDSYETPVLTAGKTFILGYSDETAGIFAENLPVIIFDDFTTAVQYVDFPFKAKSSAMKILLPKNNASIKFFYESIENLNYISAAHQRHWISIFSKIKVPVPTNNIEQQKIASCLSSLDQLITAQKEKLELLKNHKKGLMQNLFPQEGETVPKFRFPEFENDGDWENIPLKDLSEVITKGTTPTSLGFSYVDSGVNFIKIESIIDGKINLNKAAFITNECNNVLKRSQLKENDILLSIAGALGVVTTVNKNILPANTNQALSIIRLHNENQKDYLKAFLNSNQISQEINKIKAGAAQPNISLNQVQNFRILIPKNLIEQQKIASALSSLDELISSQTDKIENLQLHKKGLMQGLFPKMID